MSGDVFDGDRALADLARFGEHGELRTGSRAAGKARSQIRRAMKHAGYEARDVETDIVAPGENGELKTHTATHVLARRKGASSDVILLVAPYDAMPGAHPSDVAATGASVLLEIARLDQQTREAVGPQHFTLLMAFVDGNGLGRSAIDATPAERFPGSDAFGRWFIGRTSNVNVRLVVWIDRVGRAQVEVARDLHSSRAYRETFFEVGEERGLQPAFIAARPLSAPGGGQEALQALGFEPLVALVGETPTDDVSAPAIGTAGAPLSGSPRSLAAVGEATWVGIARIGDRLARIDAFREDPLVGSPGVLELPGAEEAPAPEADAEDAIENGSRADDGASSQSRPPAAPR